MGADHQADGAHRQRAPVEGPLPRRPVKERALRVGIGGPVGSGKTELVACLCAALAPTLSLVVVTWSTSSQHHCPFS